MQKEGTKWNEIQHVSYSRFRTAFLCVWLNKNQVRAFKMSSEYFFKRLSFSCHIFKSFSFGYYFVCVSERFSLINSFVKRDEAMMTWNLSWCFAARNLLCAFIHEEILQRHILSVFWLNYSDSFRWIGTREKSSRESEKIVFEKVIKVHLDLTSLLYIHSYNLQSISTGK